MLKKLALNIKKFVSVKKKPHESHSYENESAWNK